MWKERYLNEFQVFDVHLVVVCEVERLHLYGNAGRSGVQNKRVLAASHIGSVTDRIMRQAQGQGGEKQVNFRDHGAGGIGPNGPLTKDRPSMG
mgnify:CR=1 FL=1